MTSFLITKGLVEGETLQIPLTEKIIIPNVKNIYHPALLDTPLVVPPGLHSGQQKEFSRRYDRKIRSETHPVYCLVVNGDSPGSKWPDREASHSPASVMTSRNSGT
jgi:hypothetical protein